MPEPTYNVTLINEEKGLKTTIKIPANEYILDAAERNGVNLPYSCRAGVCVSCTGKLVKGDVIHDYDFLKQKEMDAGFFLTCRAYPKSDCVVLTHQEDQLLDL
jgi:ferredoxin